MKQLVRAISTSVLLLGLGGCGDHLGSYTVQDVRLVDKLPENETLDWPPHPYPEFIRIELKSPFDLSAVNTGPGLYTDADFCPLRNSDRLIALGPIASDETAVDGRTRRLTADGRDRRFHYFVYIVPRSPPRKLFTNSKDYIPAYDIQREKRSVCLRLFVPGYDIIPSHSDTIEISSEVLANALKAPTQSSSS